MLLLLRCRLELLLRFLCLPCRSRSTWHVLVAPVAMLIALWLLFVAAMAMRIFVAAMAMRITLGSLSLLAFLLAALGAQDLLFFVRLASETRITGNLVVLAIVILAGIPDAWCCRPT